MDVTAFGGVLLLLLGVGMLGSRGVSTQEQWSVAGRSLGTASLVGTLVMTELNTTTLLAFSGPGYLFGWWALWLPVVFLVGLGAYTFTVAPRWQRLPATSLGGYFGLRFGPEFQVVGSGFLMLAMLGFCATYIRSADLVMQPIFGDLSPWIRSAGVTLLVLAVTLRGGLVSVARSDVAAFLLAVVLLPVGALHGARRVGMDAVGTAFADIDGASAMPPSFIASLVALTSCTYIASPWYGQRMLAARDRSSAVWSVGIAAVLVPVLYACATVVAVCYRAESADLASHETAVPVALSAWAPAGLRGLGFAVLLSIAVTTLSSMWNTWVGMATDVLGWSSIGRSRGLTVALALFTWVLANVLVDDILGKMILANIPIASLAFGILGGLFWGRTSRVGAGASMLTGLLGGAGCYLGFGDAGMYTWWWAFVAIPASFVVGVFASLMWPDTDPRAADFYRQVGEPWVR